MKLNEIFAMNKVKEHFFNKINENYSPIVALTETAISYNMGIDEVVDLLEVAPTAKGAEDWIKSVKSDFKKRYGKDWQKVLYATAWKRFGESSEMTESTTLDGLKEDLSLYPEEVVSHFTDDSTFSGYVSDNRIIGRIVKKLLDTTELKPGPVMRVAEHIKEFNRMNSAQAMGNTDKARHAARSDRILRIRDSSGKATARKF